MKNAIWIGRRQVKGLIVLLALLPLIPTSLLVHTIWLNSENDKARIVSEMNGVYRNQLRLAAERFSDSQNSRPRDEGALIQFLVHVFGESLPMKVVSDNGGTVYNSETPMSGNQFSYRIEKGEFAGWNVQIDLISEIPGHIIEEQLWTYRQALIATIITMLIACGVWLAISRGLKTDEIRKDLITTISHEIKTPVSAIKILVESLENGQMDDTRKAEYLRLISTENERIEKLAARFLTYGRLERGQLPLERNKTAVEPVLQEVTALLEPRFEAANGGICVSGERDLVVIGDRNGLTILLTNLLENALKYGGRPPKVRIDISTEGSLAIISVMDNGEGIPLPEKKAVFQRFYRSEGRLDDGQTGVGLGLAICRRITKLMKGTLTLEESVHPDYKGARFRIRLPLNPETIS